MRTFPIVLMIVIGWTATATAAAKGTCPLGPAPVAQEISLTPEMLKTVGFRLSGEAFNDVQFQTLRIEYGPSEPRTADGITNPVVPITMRIKAIIPNIPLLLAKKIQRALEAQAELNSNINSLTYFFSALSFTKDNSEADASGTIYGDLPAKSSSTTPINVRLALQVTPDAKDLSFAFVPEVGATHVSAGPFVSILEHIVLPGLAFDDIFGTKLFNKLTLEHWAAHSADKNVAQMMPLIEKLAQNFNIPSLNSLVVRNLSEFFQVYDKLRLTANTRLEGQDYTSIFGFKPFNNPPKDMDKIAVSIVIERSEVRADPTTWTSLRAACKLYTQTMLPATTLDREIQGGAPLMHVVSAGETLSTITKAYFGQANLFRYIANKDQLKNPDRIYPAQTIAIPDVRQLIAANVHVVEPGDTLWTLAKQYLGDATRWRVIAKANGIAGPRDLAAGMVLNVAK